ncbi:hypothetical protein DF186_23270, partial [Enterococcus hirae]
MAPRPRRDPGGCRGVAAGLGAPVGGVGVGAADHRRGPARRLERLAADGQPPRPRRARRHACRAGDPDAAGRQRADARAAP